MLEYRIRVEAAQVELTSDELLLLGAAAITWLDACNKPIYEPLPGECPLWPEIIINALVTDSQVIEKIQYYLNLKQSQKQVIAYEMHEIPHEDWARVGLKQFKRTRFGERLWVSPSHELPAVAQDYNVLLDPGLAFGTGSHATTALCLTWLDKNIMGPVTVIDYGCGSGILAIAAIKLGARQVFAVDYDAQALLACEMNAKNNDVANEIVICEPTNIPAVKADVLMANIISNTLISLVQDFVNLLKPHGKIVLSGILQDQITEVNNAFKQHFQMSEPIIKDEWVLLEGFLMS